MATDIKATLTDSVIRLLRIRTGQLDLDRARAITELVKLGMPNGNAQRLMDEVTDVQLSRLEQVAGKLKVQPAELLGGSSPANVTMGAVTTSGSPTPPTLPQALPVVLEALRKLPRQQRQALAADWAALLAAPDSTELAGAVLEALSARPDAQSGKAAA